MAHFARVIDGIVTQVVAVNNDAISGGHFPDSEPLGKKLLADSGLDGDWIQCSYNASFRGAYPSAGFAWDGDNFIAPPEPEPTWPPSGDNL